MTTTSSKDKEKVVQNSSSNKNKQVNTNDVLIGDKSNSHTPPFMLTFEIFNKNVHNFLVDSGASSNIIPYFVCKKINAQPHKYDHTNCTT
jgi:predicted aspartyl protease